MCLKSKNMDDVTIVKRNSTNNIVRSPAPPNDGSSVSAEVTAFVLLTGILVGLLLVVIVLCICKCCVKTSKPLKRQQVVFTKYSSERENTWNGKEASSCTKYHSMEPRSSPNASGSIPVSVEVGFVEGATQLATTTREPEDRLLEVSTFSPSNVRYPDDRAFPECSRELSPKNSPEESPVVQFPLVPRTPEEIRICKSRRFPRSPPIQRQSSVCFTTSDEHLDRYLSATMEDADSSRSQPVVTLASPEESSSFEDANGDDKLVLAANALIRSETTVSAEVHQEPRTFVEPDGLPPYFRSQVNLHSKPEHKIPSFESSVSKVATSSRDGVRGLRDVGGVVRSSESMKRLSPDANLSQQWLRPASATDVRRTIEEDDDERERWRPEDDVDADLRHSGSTEDSLLGKMMEVRCRENSLLLARGSVVHLSDDDEEPKSKVRYNDTGSLEEVNEEVIDMFTDDLAVTPETATREPEELEDTEVVVIEGDVVVIEEPEIEDVLQFSVQDELIALQYRKLWALRATFEEEENVEDGDAEAEAEDDTGADDQEHDKVDYQKEEKNGVDDTQQEQEDMSEVLSVEPQSEPPAALEAEAELSEVIIVQEDCYCSSTVADQGSIGCVADESEDSDCPARDALLNRAQRGPMSSQEARRQSYKNILTKRVKKMEHKSDQQQGGGGSCSVDNSFDSVETEGSSTDASRREVVTTSLESTTDNTDSTGEGQINRLQQMKADSGYKSLETNGGNTFRPIKKQIHFALEDDGCGIETMETDDPGRPLQENIHLTLDDKTVSTVTLNLPSPSSSGARRKDRFSVSSVQRSSNGKTASKKRREYTRERHVVESSFGSVVVAEFDTDISPKSDSLSVQDDLDDGQGKASVFLRFFRSGRELPVSTLSRDFSIDEKSDTLFREFSRRDPTYELGTRCRSPRLHSRHRLYHRHSERAADGSTTSGATGSPRRGRSKLSPQESIEEEEQHGRSEMEGDLLGRTMVHIPTIKVAGENSS